MKMWHKSMRVFFLLSRRRKGCTERGGRKAGREEGSLQSVVRESSDTTRKLLPERCEGLQTQAAGKLIR